MDHMKKKMNQKKKNESKPRILNFLENGRTFPKTFLFVSDFAFSVFGSLGHG